MQKKVNFKKNTNRQKYANTKAKGRRKYVEAKYEAKRLAAHTPPHHDIKHLDIKDQMSVIKNRDKLKTIDNAIKYGSATATVLAGAGDASGSATDILSQTGIPQQPKSGGGNPISG